MSGLYRMISIISTKLSPMTIMLTQVCDILYYSINLFQNIDIGWCIPFRIALSEPGEQEYLTSINEHWKMFSNESCSFHRLEISSLHDFGICNIPNSGNQESKCQLEPQLYIKPPGTSCEPLCCSLPVTPNAPLSWANHCQGSLAQSIIPYASVYQDVEKGPIAMTNTYTRR